VAKKRKVTAKRVLIGIASLILVSCFFILGPNSCSSTSKLFAVILVKISEESTTIHSDFSKDA